MVKLHKDNDLQFLWLYKEVNLLKSHKYYYIMTDGIKYSKTQDNFKTRCAREDCSYLYISNTAVHKS